jgi:2-(1,2-epoxy-1,2-dihydrophenyl)acetyl-CoA isomerase
MSEHLLLEKVDQVAIITLNRPETRNAMNEGLRKAFGEAVLSVKADQSIRCLVITGTDPAFCAGADLTEAQAFAAMAPTDMRDLVMRMHRSRVLALRQLPIPTIAAVNGPAIGGGCELALACDIRIASERATFCEAFVNIGLSPDGGGTYLLPRVVGLGHTCELALTGKIIDAYEAVRIGLASRATPHGEMMHEVMTLARRIASKSRTAVQLIKKAIYAEQELSFEDALSLEAEHAVQLSKSQEFASRVHTFIRKRDSSA